ncbi:membrane protein [Arthrobacter phage Shambre1]|uniref:Membrane protein n=1 Tax=Arthrobacter phage Shambre1 TaxID=2927284 RepID=A0A977KNK0_9CAUD|nr:membrane protein [Arthrobacter phage Shambre1]UXE04760.1 membrane protein [Arthrobacter phage Shambre1]
MFEIPAGVGDWTAGTLLVIVVLLILTDRLVTRGRLLDEREEKKLWQANAETQQTINQENTKTISSYAEAALLQKKVLKALQEQHQLQNISDGEDT